MDNHRIALWCWLQHIDLKNEYNFVHIDMHTDTLYSRIDELLVRIREMQNFEKLSLNEYLEINIQYGDYVLPVISWGNYLSIFLELYPNLVHQLYMITHSDVAYMRTL